MNKKEIRKEIQEFIMWAYPDFDKRQTMLEAAEKYLREEVEDDETNI